MLLSELLNVAKYSELNTLAVKDDIPALVSFVNLGLIDLYGLFSLRTEEHIIELEDGVTIYDLPADFMFITGAYEAPSIFSNDNSINLPINEEGNARSVNTINFKQVQIPLSLTGDYVGIIYVAKPELMTADNLDVDLPIPDQLVQPLLNFIAFKGQGGVTVNGQTEGDIYYARYRRSCDDIKRQGISIASDDLGMSNRLGYRGFP